MCYRPLVLTMLLFNTVLSGCASTDSMESQLKATPSEGAGSSPSADGQAPGPPLQQGLDQTRGELESIQDHLYRPGEHRLPYSGHLVAAEHPRLNQMQHDVRKMATFMHTQFVRAFQNDPQHRVRVVLTPGERLSDPGDGHYGVGPQQGLAQCHKSRRPLWLRSGRGGIGKGRRSTERGGLRSQG